MPVEVFDPWILVKIAFLVALGIYAFFAFVVVRQVYLMTSTVQTGAEFLVKTIGWVHLLISVGVFLLALVIL